jgi:hypothetical protein
MPDDLHEATEDDPFPVTASDGTKSPGWVALPIT